MVLMLSFNLVIIVNLTGEIILKFGNSTLGLTILGLTFDFCTFSCSQDQKCNVQYNKYTSSLSFQFQEVTAT